MSKRSLLSELILIILPKSCVSKKKYRIRCTVMLAVVFVVHFIGGGGGGGVDSWVLTSSKTLLD